MKTRKIYAAVGSNIGKKRTNNEDNFYFNGTWLEEQNRDAPTTLIGQSEDQLQIFAVCDGMGGEAFGEVASLIASETLAKYQGMLNSIPYHDFDKYIDMYIAEVNNLISEQSAKNHGVRIGTTIALLCIEGNTARCYNVGDSRVYLLRGRKLRQLSEDHTQAVRAVKMGIMTALEAKTHPHRNKLTQHLGMSAEEMIVEPHRTSFEMKKGDKFLLCSDGITDMMDEKVMQDILKQKAEEGAITTSLVNVALQNGGKDNITAIIVKVL